MNRECKILALTAFLMSIMGYVLAFEGPSETVDKYLTAYISKDYTTAYGYLTSESKKDKSEADFKEENAKASLIAYKIENTKIEKDKAEVRVTLVSLDMKQVFEKAIKSLPKEVWLAVVFGKISDKEMENILRLSIQKEVDDYLEEGRKEVINLLQEEDGWKVAVE